MLRPDDPACHENPYQARVPGHGRSGDGTEFGRPGRGGVGSRWRLATMVPVQVLRFATRSHIESVFAENHDLWGRPLTADQYREFWFSLFLTAWGSSNLRYMALTEEEDG